MKKIAALLLCLSMLTCTVITVCAEEIDPTPGEATIGTEVPDKHKLRLTVTGDVDVKVNGEDGKEFTVDRLSEPVLEIKAKDGKKITKVVLNGEDVTDQLKDGKLKLPGIYEDSEYVLSAETENISDPSSKSESSSKKAETVSAYSPKPNASNANPATGVAGGVSLGTAVLLAAIGIARNKGSEDEEE
ncbi:MAG: hypothetical protein E7494_15450 [Ruminococcus albus]|jgi:hypothetical protein|nr:hypothetical protein [Ruminococcus albus]